MKKKTQSQKLKKKNQSLKFWLIFRDPQPHPKIESSPIEEEEPIGIKLVQSIEKEKPIGEEDNEMEQENKQEIPKFEETEEIQDIEDLKAKDEKMY